MGIICEIATGNCILESVREPLVMSIRGPNRPFDAALLEASAHGFDPCVQALIDVGANLRAREQNGDTSLMNAAENGHVSCMRSLLEAGAGVNEENWNGSALSLAAENGQIECVKLLVESGANVNMASMIGTTPLILAAKTGRTECVEILMQAGADVNGSNMSNHTPLCINHSCDPTLKGHKHCSVMLVPAGADVNAVCYSGWTPLYAAAGNGHIGCVKVLIEAGANVNAFVSNAFVSTGKTVLSCTGDPAIVKLLLKSGAHVNTEVALNGRILRDVNSNMEILQIFEAAGQRSKDICKEPKRTINLMNICREAIKEHLLDLDPHENLFVRVPQLGLPSSLDNFLLNYVSLE